MPVTFYVVQKLALSASGCLLGPDYQRPKVESPAADAWNWSSRAS